MSASVYLPLSDRLERFLRSRIFLRSAIGRKGDEVGENM